MRDRGSALKGLRKSIMETLKRGDRTLSAKDISVELKRSQQVVARTLKDMADDLQVQRYPGPGHSYVYRWRGLTSKDIAEVMTTINPGLAQAISPAAFATLLRPTAAEQLKERLGTAIDLLIDAISSVDRLASDAADGERVAAYQLTDQLAKVSHARQTVGKLLTNIDRILVTQSLWNLETMPEFVALSHQS